MISFVFGGTSSTDKDTLNVEIPLKTKSIAPYETDIPVKTGALESLLKCRRMVSKTFISQNYHQVSDNQLELTLKDNIKFQNGHHLTGEAVKRSLEEGMKK